MHRDQLRPKGSCSTMFASRSGPVDTIASGQPDEFFQRAQVGAGGGGQLVPLGDAVRVFAPAGELEVHRRAFFPAGGVERRVFGALAAVFVGDAHLQRLHAVEDVELGDAQAGDAVDRDRALERDDVHPAAAARAAGGGAEFLAALADALADFVVEFGRERAAADARGVGLGDAEHVVDRIRADAGAGERAADGGVGRGDVRIGAVVDVEQRALRAFEQHALRPACAARGGCRRRRTSSVRRIRRMPALRRASSGSRPLRPSRYWVSTKLW